MKSLLTIVLLVVANVFMTLAWYGHLKFASGTSGAGAAAKQWPLVAVVFASWGIALFEYFFQVPANRIGFADNGGPFTLIQLKIIQEVVSLSVFVIFALLVFRNETFRWNHIASFLCLIAAVWFAFRK